MEVDRAALLVEAQHRRGDASAGINLQSLGNGQPPPPSAMVASGKLKDMDTYDDSMTEVEKLKQQRREAKAATKGAFEPPTSRDGPVLMEDVARPSNVRRISEAVDDLEWVANDDGTFSSVSGDPSLATIDDEEDDYEEVESRGPVPV
jgi:hypothetical protein